MRQAFRDEPYFARRTQLDLSQQLVLAPSKGGEIVAGRFRRDSRDLGVTQPNTPSDQLMVVIHMRPLAATDLWRDERHVRSPDLVAGALKILDQRERWQTHLKQPFDTFNLFIPHLAFRDLAEQMRSPIRDEFDLDIETPCYDRVMLHLASALLPSLARPHELSRLFADSIFTAMRLHLAQTYGGMSAVPPSAPHGLSGWQEARVREMLLDELARDHDPSSLADACGVSRSHFARLFKITMGAPPHRWLMNRRIEAAKQRLIGTSRTINDIALECGFADQSHFIRVFKGVVGFSPGAWRRMMVQ